MIDDILPDAVQPYLRAITQASDSYGRIASQIVDISAIGRTTVPDGWMPWLLRDRGLQALMPYVDWPLLLEEGTAWLTIRGTAQASIDALGWIGWDVTFEDGDIGTGLYDHYQIHLDRVPWHDDLLRIIGVEDVAKSTDSVFFRLEYGWDVRQFRFARSRWGAALFGRSSGVDVRPDWPRLSFREHVLLAPGSETTAITAETLTDATFATTRGDIVFSKSRWGSKQSPGPVFGIDLSDSIVVLGGADHRAAERILPAAGLRFGFARFGARQSVFLATRMIFGERPRFGQMRFMDPYRLGFTELLMRVPDPFELTAVVSAGATAEIYETLIDVMEVHVTDRLVVAADEPDGPYQLGAIANLGNAPWSGLPWSDAPWGEGQPKSFASDETETP